MSRSETRAAERAARQAERDQLAAEYEAELWRETDASLRLDPSRWTWATSLGYSRHR